MAKEWEKWIDKVCKIVFKTKEYTFVENFVQSYVESYCREVLRKILPKNWLEKFARKIV